MSFVKKKKKKNSIFVLNFLKRFKQVVVKPNWLPSKDLSVKLWNNFLGLCWGVFRVDRTQKHYINPGKVACGKAAVLGVLDGIFRWNMDSLIWKNGFIYHKNI